MLHIWRIYKTIKIETRQEYKSCVCVWIRKLFLQNKSKQPREETFQEFSINHFQESPPHVVYVRGAIREFRVNWMMRRHSSSIIHNSRQRKETNEHNKLIPSHHHLIIFNLYNYFFAIVISRGITITITAILWNRSYKYTIG